MRTQQYMQVESIVVKYETLASNTEAVKKTENSFTDFFVPNDCMRLMFMDQLIGRIYQLRAGTSANPDVVKEYSEAASFYIKGLLLEDEEQFLVDNFDSFVDYAFDHSNTVVTLGKRFDKPSEWSCLVPYLLDHSSRKVFIAHSDDGREFVGLKDCDLTVEGGFENALYVHWLVTKTFMPIRSRILSNFGGILKMDCLMLLLLMSVAGLEIVFPWKSASTLVVALLEMVEKFFFVFQERRL